MFKKIYLIVINFYYFILNVKSIEIEYLTEKGEETIFEKLVYNNKKEDNSVESLTLKDVPLIKDNVLIKIVKIENNKEIELPIKNLNGTFKLDYVLSSGKYKAICYNKFGKKFVEDLDEKNKKLDKILEDREKSCCNRMC